MLYYTYILESDQDGSFYIGHTADLSERLKSHNAGKTKSIKSKLPFVLIYYEAYLDKTVAIKRERRLKKNRREKILILQRIYPERDYRL